MYPQYLQRRIDMRIGNGYDVHKLVEGRKLILGGVEIPYEKGLLGHSDADVLVHAIMDALLGALAKGDIGKLFPDSSAEFKDISSILLLKKVNEVLKKENYLTELDGKYIFLGSIVLCENKIKEQAKELGHSEERERTYLIVHGLMHLFGYDHIKEEDKKEMREKEKQALKILGIED